MTQNSLVDDYINTSNEEQKEILSQLRKLISKAVPGCMENFKWKRPVYSLKADFCYLQKNKHHINFGFMKAEKLNDPKKLLEGSGKSMRHIKVNSLSQIDDDYFDNLIIEAIS